MRLIPRSMVELAFKIAKAVKQEKTKTPEVVVDYYPEAVTSHYQPGSRRNTYHWPGRRAAAALRTAGKTRRMR